MDRPNHNEWNESYPADADLPPGDVEQAMAAARQWASAAEATPPISFVYGGRPSAEVLGGWYVAREQHPAPDGGVRSHVVWHDPDSRLECILEARIFGRFPAVEWVVRFRNGGSADTPLLENILPLDAAWACKGEATLHRSIGSLCKATDFLYQSLPLPAGQAVRMAAGGGRSSNDWLPFFNLQAGEGGRDGVIVAIGWTGQWSAQFAREGDAVRMRAGQELTHLVLRPGEEIRTPRIAMMFWHGDRQAGHNAWRRFVLAHHTPRPGGQMLRGPLTVAHWGGMKTPLHMERVELYRRQALACDYYWIDAGWYGPPDSYSPDEFTGDWYKHVGNWDINPAAHPDGLRPISDAAADAGMKFLLWFEPERAVVGTPLTVEHPDWFLGERKEGASLLLNLGNAEARRWLTDFVLRFCDEQGVDLYRQDFNFDPLPYWRAADAPDRQGITEIRHVEGLYAFWDELLASRPGLIIDNCASGGRRIDLETIGRSIPLWRSDWQCWPTNDPAGGQTHGMGLSQWVPLHGTGVWGGVPERDEELNYRVRSSYGPAFQFSIFPYERTPVREDYPWDAHRARLEEYRRLRPLFYGDYYPLTTCTDAPDAWAAYQVHRPDLAAGAIVAFRRPGSPFVVADLRPRAVDAAAEYEFEDADTGQTCRQPGKQLIDAGLRVTMEHRPASRVIFYRKAR